MSTIKLVGWYEPDLQGLLAHSLAVLHTLWFLYKPAVDGASMGFEEVVELWKPETDNTEMARR